MRKFLHIGIGFVLGVVCTLGVLAIMPFSSNSHDENKEPVNHGDAETKIDMTQLHIGLPKDSVLLIYGEPDEFSSTSLQGRNVEHIAYKVNNSVVPNLEFTFVDGALTSYSKR